jgi:NAD(P)-dependent dehydrogenase (short-subunit alcohol dehydrogenase family)
MKIKGKVAIVTGGAYGLGNAFLRGYASEGAKVFIADIDFEAAKLTEEESKEKGMEALALKINVSSYDYFGNDYLYCQRDL